MAGVLPTLAVLLALCFAAAPASAQQATTVVPNYWGLIPSGLGPGDEFRLLFVSSTDRNAVPTNIGTYNTWIQNLAANGHADIQGYSSTFRVVGSTRAVDARDNTETTGTGVPIYWLNGDQVADNYPDFYDGSWDQEASMRTESGSTVSAGDGTTVAGVWTGSANDGTEFINQFGLGRNMGVTVARPNQSTPGDGPLSSNDSVTKNGSAELYGLSGVFRVNPPLPPEGDLGATNVFAKRYRAGEVKITWNDITIDGAPLPPGLPDYAVTVSGGRRDTTWALSNLETVFGDPLGRGNRYTVEHPTSTSTNNNQSDDDVAFTYTLKVIGDGWLASGNEAVSIRLPAGSVETSDGRGLESSVSATVNGPAGIAVADARVDENTNAALAFAVTLDRAASGTVTVDYATSNGTATAGADYTATSGTLRFAAGEQSKSVSVAVLDDDHDEGEETVTLTLSNASGARITDGTATGTIKNRDPLPRALLARFGRTAAVHVVEHVEERIAAPREPGVEGRVAGRALRPGMAREIALNVLSQLGASVGGNPVGAGVHDPRAGAPTAGVAALGTPGRAGGGVGMATMTGPMDARAGSDRSLTSRGLFDMGLGGGDLLTGSAVAVNRETHGGILSFWSRGAQSNFSGREGALSLGGDVRTTMVGADYAKGPLVAGLSLSHSRGLGEYVGVTGGQVASSVTGLYPWLGYQVTDRVSVWGVTGYGAGGLWLTPNGGPALRSGLSMAMAAAGTRGELVAGGSGGFALAFKADALWVGTSIDGVDGAAGRLAATNAAVSRFRTGLEGSRAYTLAGRLSLRPSVEVGLRHDGGDAETGAGMDVGAGLVMADVGYGLPVGSRFVGTPTVGVGTSAYGRDYRLGYRLGALGGAGTTVEFGVDAQRRESPLVGGTDHGARAQATVGW